MPVVEVRVIKAYELEGVPLEKSFSVVVRLQGQSMRTERVSLSNGRAAIYGERFRFRYTPAAKGNNILCAEVWSKSFFSQLRVSEAWLDMDEPSFVRGQEMVFDLHGGFEGRRAAVSLGVTMLDAGLVPRSAGAMAPPAQHAPLVMPVAGIPVEPVYSTASYLPADVPVVQASAVADVNPPALYGGGGGNSGANGVAPSVPCYPPPLYGSPGGADEGAAWAPPKQV